MIGSKSPPRHPSPLLTLEHQEVADLDQDAELAQAAAVLLERHTAAAHLVHRLEGVAVGAAGWLDGACEQHLLALVGG